MIREGRKNRFWRTLLALDQLLNVVVFNGDEDETVSSNAGKAALQGRRWGCVLCRILDVFDRDHCTKAIEADEGKAL